MKNLMRMLAIIPLQLSIAGCLPSEETKSTSSSVTNNNNYVSSFDTSIYQCANLSADKISYIDSIEQKVLNASETFENIRIAARELGRIGCARSAEPIVTAAQRILSAGSVDANGYLQIPYNSGEALTELVSALATVRSDYPGVLVLLESVAGNDKIYGSSAQSYARRSLDALQIDFYLQNLTSEFDIRTANCTSNYLLADGSYVNFLQSGSQIADIIVNPTSPYLLDIAKDQGTNCFRDDRATAAVLNAQLSQADLYPFIAEVLRASNSKHSVAARYSLLRMNQYREKSLVLFTQYLMPFLDGREYLENDEARAWLVNELYATWSPNASLESAIELQPIFEGHLNELYFQERLFAAIGREIMYSAQQVTVVPAETLPVEE